MMQWLSIDLVAMVALLVGFVAMAARQQVLVQQLVRSVDRLSSTVADLHAVVVELRARAALVNGRLDRLEGETRKHS